MSSDTIVRSWRQLLDLMKTCEGGYVLLHGFSRIAGGSGSCTILVKHVDRFVRMVRSETLSSVDEGKFLLQRTDDGFQVRIGTVTTNVVVHGVEPSGGDRDLPYPKKVLEEVLRRRLLHDGCYIPDPESLSKLALIDLSSGNVVDQEWLPKIAAFLTTRYGSPIGPKKSPQRRVFMSAKKSSTAGTSGVQRAS